MEDILFYFGFFRSASWVSPLRLCRMNLDVRSCLGGGIYFFSPYSAPDSNLLPIQNLFEFLCRFWRGFLGVFFNVYLYICIYMYTYTCICTNMCMYIHLNVYLCICMYMHVYIYVYVYVYVCIYICIHKRVEEACYSRVMTNKCVTFL